MINYLKNIFSFIGISFILNLVAFLLKSDFWGNFLADNILIIIITLMAVNVATSSIIISKLQEIGEKYKHDFNNSYSELRKSLSEQVVLIVLSIILLILRDSEILTKSFQFYIQTIDTLLLSVFLYSIDILYDTGKSIFLIIQFRSKNDESRTPKQ